jgi:plastocyanin
MRGVVERLRAATASLAVVWAVAAPAGLGAQGTLERGPNVEGPWVARAGVVHFNFLHRFQVTGAPARKVVNSPTFLLAAGVPGDLMVGSRYATSSLLVEGRPNEWELFGRWSPLREGRGAPLDAAVQVARNGTAGSWDGEVLLARTVGRLRLLAGARAFSSFAGGDGEAAWLAGAVFRLGRHVAVAADVADLVGGGGRAAWGAALQLAIPYTPHTLSLHRSSANATTLQSATVGMEGARWGFEFTVPFTVRRYLGPGDGARAATVPAASGAPEPVVTVDMDNLMRYLPDTVRVAVGESVRWRNGSDIVHTVTADPGRAELAASARLPSGASPFDSGDLRPGEEFVQRFTVPGEYVYFCVPHERTGMVGVVIVQ